MSIRVAYMTDKEDIEWLEVHYDDDGALDGLRVYEPISDEWLPVKLDRVPSRALAKVMTFIARELERDHHPFDGDPYDEEAG